MSSKASKPSTRVGKQPRPHAPPAPPHVIALLNEIADLRVKALQLAQENQTLQLREAILLDICHLSQQAIAVSATFSDNSNNSSGSPCASAQLGCSSKVFEPYMEQLSSPPPCNNIWGQVVSQPFKDNINWDMHMPACSTLTSSKPLALLEYGLLRLFGEKVLADSTTQYTSAHAHGNFNRARGEIKREFHEVQQLLMPSRPGAPLICPVSPKLAQAGHCEAVPGCLRNINV